MKKANDENSKGEKVSCEMCDKLEKYKILYQAYADEIKNLWQRSIFLGTFMVLVWTGYGALQLKFIEHSKELSEFYVVYHCVSIGLCTIIIFLSLLWVMMAKGSKFVQEAHEKHIENLNFDKLNEVDIKTNQYKKLFCDLNIYEDKLKLENKLSEDLFYSEALKACRYSPSKINIILGCFSVIVAIILSIVHIVIAFYNETFQCMIILASIALMLICLCSFHIRKCVKGGKLEQSENLTTNTQNQNSAQGGTNNEQQ